MKKKVGLDPGHGGKDTGAMGGGMKESKINWNVVGFLKEILIKRGYEVYVTKEADETIGLVERARRIMANHCDVYLSVHHNASATGKADGFDIIYQSDPKVTKPSQRLASFAEAEFKLLNNKHRVFSRPSTKILNEDYHTILALPNIPGIITELCFIDNVNDVQIINTFEEQRMEAEALADSIDKYFGN